MTIERQCSKCGESRPADSFQRYKGRPSGQCRACKTEGMKARRAADGIPAKAMSVVADGMKSCMACATMKSFDEFSPSERGTAGVSAYCRPCAAAKSVATISHETARRRTREYRARHREVHLTRHRLQMFERRAKIKVMADGTVTEEFLRTLYAAENCHYCMQGTPVEKRTADHRIALSAGGHHSAVNLVMACHSCNSTKRDLSEDEFIQRLKNGYYRKNHRGLDKYSDG